MVDSMENHKFDLGVKGLNVVLWKCKLAKT